MGSLQKRRVFFALWPADEAAAHLAALAGNLAGRGSRLIPAKSLHMTLAFVGAVTSPRISQLETIAGKVSGDAFDLRLDRLGFWPQRGIVWAGCRQSPEPLKRLFKSLADGLSGAGFAIDEPTGPARVAHVSLARHARCRSLPRLGTPIGWHVSEFALVESHLHPTAARYETLAVFPLQDAGAG